ncbi:MAG: sulfurtransferase [Acidimicrobiales bacterium]
MALQQTTGSFDSLVSTDWLAASLGPGDLVVLDCTTWLRRVDDGFKAVSGRAEFDAGHVPGARFADLTGDLCDNTGPYRFVVPTPEHFAAAMSALGVHDDSRVVLYDQNGSMWAARVWWMLRWIGFDRAALLDGGFGAWQADGRPVESGPATQPRPGRMLTVAPRPELIAHREDVLAAIDDGATCIIDSLGAAQYRGEQSAYGRAGHIPGAINIPAHALTDRDTGRYLPLEVLAERFPADRDRRIITYCGGGIAASSDAFVLTRLGYRDVAVYTASLQEWVTNHTNPLVVEH